MARYICMIGRRATIFRRWRLLRSQARLSAKRESFLPPSISRVVVSLRAKPTRRLKFGRKIQMPPQIHILSPGNLHAIKSGTEVTRHRGGDLLPPNQLPTRTAHSDRIEVGCGGVSEVRSELATLRSGNRRRRG